MHSGLQSPTYRRVRARTCVRFTTANQYQGVMTQTAAVAATTAAVAAILCRDEVLYVRCASILRRKLFVCMRWTRLLAPPTLNSPARQSAIALENDTRIQVYTRCLLASLPFPSSFACHLPIRYHGNVRPSSFQCTCLARHCTCRLNSCSLTFPFLADRTDGRAYASVACVCL